MGFFNLLKKKATEDAKRVENSKRHDDEDLWSKFNVEKRIDDSAYKANYEFFVNSKCPSCEQKVKGVSQKNTCPHCGEPIINERHFHTKTRMLLTKEQAERLKVEIQHYSDLKWALKLALELGANDREIMAMSKSTKVNSKYVVLWVRANDLSMFYATNSKWLSYRNTRLAMGDIKNREGYKKEAIGFVLSVCFMDLNNPDDEGNFNPSQASLKRPVVQTALKLAKELSLDDKELKQIYLTASAAEKNRFMPLEPADTWNTFWREYIKVRSM